MADTKTTNDDLTSTVIGSEHVSQDVNTDEALSVSNATMNNMTQMNMKRTYDLHQSLDTEAILRTRRNEDAEQQMRLRHAEDLHTQKMQQDNDLHTIRVQTLAVSATGNSKIIESIATDTANDIVTMVRSKLAS